MNQLLKMQNILPLIPQFNPINLLKSKLRLCLVKLLLNLFLQSQTQFFYILSISHNQILFLNYLNFLLNYKIPSIIIHQLAIFIHKVIHK